MSDEQVTVTIAYRTMIECLQSRLLNIAQGRSQTSTTAEISQPEPS